jgi:hypothetical protein
MSPEGNKSISQGVTPEPEMNAEEFALWNSLDIKGFSSSVSIIHLQLSAIMLHIQKRDTRNLPDELQNLRVVCKQFAERVQQIDPNNYHNYSFPVEIIREIRRQIPVTLREILQMIETAVANTTLADGTIEKIKEKINSIEDFSAGINTPEYQRYRQIVGQRGEQGRS